MVCRVNGRWVLKKKFATGWIALGMAFMVALLTRASVGEFGAVMIPLVTLVLGADVADKRLNGGAYDAKG